MKHSAAAKNRRMLELEAALVKVEISCDGLQKRMEQLRCNIRATGLPGPDNTSTVRILPDIMSVTRNERDAQAVMEMLW